MYASHEVRVVHLEITSRCNAACPQCPRNVQGGALNPHLPLTELSLAELEVMLPPDFLRQLDSLYLCGNYGDPMVASDTLPALRYFRSASVRLSLRMNTNASGRDAAWWRALGGVVNTCVFSIDGLEHTNSIYRRGTDWRRIMAAVTAFIGAGGRAEWEYIVFRHNEADVERARALSREMGFARFTAKRSDRFIANGLRVERTPVRNRDGEIEYYIEAPLDPRYRNEGIIGMDDVVRRIGYRRYIEETEIDCKAARNRNLYITAEGLVFPCCFTGKLYFADRPPGAMEMWRMIERLPGGRDAIDARLHPIGEIVDGPLFQQLIPEGWSTSGGGRTRTETCARICGKFDTLLEQYRQS